MYVWKGEGKKESLVHTDRNFHVRLLPHGTLSGYITHNDASMCYN